MSKTTTKTTSMNVRLDTATRQQLQALADDLGIPDFLRASSRRTVCPKPSVEAPPPSPSTAEAAPLRDVDVARAAVEKRKSYTRIAKMKVKKEAKGGQERRRAALDKARYYGERG